ncbi:uncharacterized protein LOC117220939 [Megalopta genalis]|uniref:uncharacterized protein LOC117220939 n=1 Tax=Megalopta genalis TaxID=115081 RepID=UPI003FD3D724
MKCAYVLLSTCCLLSYGLAKPAAPLLNYQDSFGQYSFGYSSPDSARSEVRTLDGVTHGSYSYIDDTGTIQSAEYTADDHGFRITATNLPQGTASVQNPLVYGADGKPVLNIQKLDQLVDKSDTNVFLKQAKQEATLEGKKQLEVTATPDAGSTGSASTDPQTRIGDSNVFLQKEGSALVPEEEPSVGAVPNVGSIASIFSDVKSEATIGENNVFLKKAKEERESASEDKTLTDGRIGNLEANVKSEPDNAAPEAKPKLENSEGNLNVAAMKSEGALLQKDASLTNSSPASTTILRLGEEELKALSGRIDAKEPSMPEKTQTRSQEKQQATIDAPIIAPISLIPFDGGYPTLVRYGAQHYIIYTNP